MKSEHGKIIHFKLKNIKGVSVTQGYNISNVFPVHFHSSYILGVIELGEREFTYRGETSILKPDDIFIVQPFEPHSGKSVDNSDHSYKVISLNLNASYYFPKLVLHQTDLGNKIKEFHALAEYEHSSIQLISLYDEIILQLRKFSVENYTACIDENTSSKISLAKQFIENNCMRDISLKEISSVACLSEFHFNRIFHRCYGLSPYAYYIVCKMKKSQKVILEQKSVIETTYDIGFFDQSHFTKLFKKHIGVTPGKYLRDNKELMNK
ncbi:MAG: AraC family transcriptional regulator [Bacteroidales bacterium]|nr:AraC family transcriptional regulator [Bacteroidales bacterium]